MRQLLFVIIIVTILDNIFPFCLAPFYKGYTHKMHALSVLGCKQSPVKQIYNIWCIVSGIAFCFFGYAVYNAYPGGVSLAVGVLLAIYGIGCEIMSGLFPLNENKKRRESFV